MLELLTGLGWGVFIGVCLGFRFAMAVASDTQMEVEQAWDASRASYIDAYKGGFIEGHVAGGNEVLAALNVDAMSSEDGSDQVGDDEETCGDAEDDYLSDPDFWKKGGRPSEN